MTLGLSADIHNPIASRSWSPPMLTILVRYLDIMLMNIVTAKTAIEAEKDSIYLLTYLFTYSRLPNTRTGPNKRTGWKIL